MLQTVFVIIKSLKELKKSTYQSCFQYLLQYQHRNTKC
jgi:hypothetical protein